MLRAAPWARQSACVLSRPRTQSKLRRGAAPTPAWSQRLLLPPFKDQAEETVEGANPETIFRNQEG